MCNDPATLDFREVFVVTQHHDASLTRRQLPQRAPHLVALDDTHIERFRSHVGYQRALVPTLDLPAPPTAPHRVHDGLAQVRHDIVDSAAPQATVNASERVTNRVFGAGRVAFEERGEPQRRRVVLREKLAERRVTSGPGSLHPSALHRHARHVAQTRHADERLPGMCRSLVRPTISLRPSSRALACIWHGNASRTYGRRSTARTRYAY